MSPRGGNRTPESTARWVAQNRRDWLFELKVRVSGPFTSEEAQEIWGCEISTARNRLRELYKAGFLVVISAVKHPKPLPWVYGFTKAGSILC